MKYLELFKDIDYLSYVGAFAKWIFLFLLISIILLIVGNKFNLFCREKRFANILAKSYYLIIPIYFVLFAIKFAPIRNTQNEFNRVVDKNKVVIIEFTRSFLDSMHLEISRKMKKLLGIMVLDIRND